MTLLWEGMRSLVRDIILTRTQSEAMGLRLNIKKCEFISHIAIPKPIFKEFILLQPKHAKLLGVPLSTRDAMDEALLSRCHDFALAIDRLKLLSAHDALVLLRSSFGDPKMTHTLRSGPCAEHLSLDRFDTLLRDGLCHITNSFLTDVSWT